ncbi:MAG: histidine--tRNA ligase, partial [Nitrospinota bacterium]
MARMTKYKAIKGVKDIISPDIERWHILEEEMKRAFGLYRFSEIRIPIFENTAVFVRSIGDTTDIVEKEMYTFEDRGGENLTLRPEGTASVVRAYVEHQMFTSSSVTRLYYMGPMFRRERPQAGRYRQFYQIGAEVFGEDSPEIDAETITMLMEALSNLKLKNLTLHLNSLGCDECRPVFKESLKKFVKERLDSFCPNCQNRYERNPLRIFDCKNPGCQKATKGAPTIDQALCPVCVEHFDKVKDSLTKSGVKYNLNNRLVRGLDYYSKTTFEISAEGIGAQNSIAGGGRYDKLVEEFGGPATPAFGFALGVERTVPLIDESIKTD